MSTAAGRAVIAQPTLDAVALITGLRAGDSGPAVAASHPANTAFVLACMLDELLPRIFADGGTEFLRRFALTAAHDWGAGNA